MGFFLLSTIGIHLLVPGGFLLLFSGNRFECQIMRSYQQVLALLPVHPFFVNLNMSISDE